MSDNDLNATFNAKLDARFEERARLGAKLPQEYESLEAYHEERHARRAPELQVQARGGFEQLKRRR